MSGLEQTLYCVRVTVMWVRNSASQQGWLGLPSHCLEAQLERFQAPGPRGFEDWKPPGTVDNTYHLYTVQWVQGAGQGQPETLTSMLLVPGLHFEEPVHKDTIYLGLSFMRITFLKTQIIIGFTQCFYTQTGSNNYQSIQIKSTYDQVETFQSFPRNKIGNIKRDCEEMQGDNNEKCQDNYSVYQ